jgi:hypothetical protein
VFVIYKYIYIYIYIERERERDRETEREREIGRGKIERQRVYPRISLLLECILLKECVLSE